MERNRKIIKTSIIGILLNGVLLTGKFIIGLLSGSIAIILDAVNNLSDALSSIITIIGTKLASKSPDKKHPYGHGRVEYISTIVIALVILIAGVSSLRESITTIIEGQKATYTTFSLILVALAVLIKYLMGRYTVSVGKSIDAKSLVASGKEALYDCILSIATLFAAFVSIFFNISIEGWIGAIISLVIIKAGCETMAETLGIIIGLRSEKELTHELKALINEFPEVHGTYDVILHNYGPASHIGSAHIEIDEGMDTREIHHLTQRIMYKVYEKMNIVITIGIYANIKTDDEAITIMKTAAKMTADYKGILQMHGFYKDKDVVGFDLVIDFKEDSLAIKNDITSRLSKIYPQYTFNILLDLDYSD